MMHSYLSVDSGLFFFFTNPATAAFYTLSLHDALPICRLGADAPGGAAGSTARRAATALSRSEEHTSELQSRRDLVCRLLLEKKMRLRRGKTGVSLVL